MMTTASRASGATRRAVLRRLSVLGVGAAAVAVVRHELAWPTPQVRFSKDGWSGWIDLPAPGGLIELEARIAGVALRAVVDSGAQFSAIDAGLAQRLALKAATPIPMLAFGVSGAPSVTRAVAADVELPELAIKGLRAATLNLQPLSGLTRQPFSLLLGRDFLRAVVAQADFPQGRVAFFAPGVWQPPQDARAVTVQETRGALMVEVKVESAPPVNVLLDTGATGALALSEQAAGAAGLLDGRPVWRNHSVTLGGVSQDGITRARQVEFAGRRLTDLEVQIFRPAPHAPVPAGLLGLGVLQRFHLALDVPGGRLFLIGPERSPRRFGPRELPVEMVPPFPPGARGTRGGT